MIKWKPRPRRIASAAMNAGGAALLIALIAVAGRLPGGSQAETLAAREIRVIDGDTIAIGQRRVRLLGLDTPETVFAECDEEKALGSAAAVELERLVRGAEGLELQTEAARDRYDRELGRLLVDGRDVAQIMIAGGWAREYDGGRRTTWCSE